MEGMAVSRDFFFFWRQTFSTNRVDFIALNTRRNRMATRRYDTYNGTERLTAGYLLSVIHLDASPCNCCATGLTRRKENRSKQSVEVSIVAWFEWLFSVETAAELHLAGRNAAATSISWWPGCASFVGGCEMIRESA
jgi:hypothetical protein